MSYWNRPEIIFEKDYDGYIFMVYWSKFKDTDERKTLGVVWSNFPKQKRGNRLAPVVIPQFLEKDTLNGLYKYVVDKKYPEKEVKKIKDILDSL